MAELIGLESEGVSVRKDSSSSSPKIFARAIAYAFSLSLGGSLSSGGGSGGSHLSVTTIGTLTRFANIVGAGAGAGAGARGASGSVGRALARIFIFCTGSFSLGIKSASFKAGLYMYETLFNHHSEGEHT